MADLPVTRKKAGMELELALNSERGYMALKPDPCEERLKRVIDALPEGTYVGFRFSQHGPRFSILELALKTTETASRRAELTDMAARVEEAWPDQRWGRVAVAPEILSIGDASQSGETFFQEEAEAAVEATA